MMHGQKNIKLGHRCCALHAE